MKYTKKSGIYAFILHNYPILVRSTGIEDVRRYEKSLGFQGFLLLNANMDAKIFWGEGMILQVLFKRKNKPNMERIVFLWYFIYLVNLVP